MSFTVLTFLLAFMFSASGCAVVGGPAPTPPLVTALPESPEVYIVGLPKWKPGAAYRVEEHTWTEEKTRALVPSTTSERHVYIVKGIDRTSRGSTRVEVTRDGVVTGVLVFGDDGHNEDYDSYFQRLIGISLKRGERRRLEVPPTVFRGRLPATVWESLKDPIVSEIEYLGLADFEGFKAHAVRETISDMVESPIKGTRGQLDKLEMEILSLVDVATGLTVVEYEKIVGAGHGMRGPVTLQIIKKSTVDRASIRGF